MKNKTRLLIEFAERLVGDFTTMPLATIENAMLDHAVFIDASAGEYVEAREEMRLRTVSGFKLREEKILAGVRSPEPGA